MVVAAADLGTKSLQDMFFLSMHPALGSGQKAFGRGGGRKEVVHQCF